VSDTLIRSLSTWFEFHPREHRAFLFHSGKIAGETELNRSLTSRVACLVSIGTDGFPVAASRWAVNYRLAEA